MISKILITALIAGLIGGTFGAGGKVGRVMSTFKSISGNSGNVGGGGNIGIVGMLRSTATHLGIGKSGNSTSEIFLGTNLNFGKMISSHAWIFDKSMKISGRWNDGIGNTGRSTHRSFSLHE